MPRNPVGPVALTAAERQAIQRAKHKARQAALAEELQRLRAENAKLGRALARAAAKRGA